MKYALVIVEVPEDIWRQNSTVMINVANEIVSKLRSKESTTVISPDVYLCDMEHGLKDVNTISTVAIERKLSTRTLFFDQAPSWVISKT